ncbi:MAG: DUF4376 domain-containing protein [Aliihoeflea sp.]|uniref:DUF4376 domain-containing protein n=1 Tax=Aliihoeflea sp. TaxID=2608088 RepID=UPI0040348A07
MTAIFPSNWYWKADDGRVYSSSVQSLVDVDISNLVDGITRWPADDDGNQTDAALEAVLRLHGLKLRPDDPKVALAAYAADRRWRAEVGGIEVGGLTVHTDDRSKMMIMGARMKASADPEFTTEWKTAAGEFITIDADTILVVSDAILNHVAACFAAEAAVIAEIETGEITDIAGIDAADWP